MVNKPPFLRRFFEVEGGGVIKQYKVPMENFKNTKYFCFPDYNMQEYYTVLYNLFKFLKKYINFPKEKRSILSRYFLIF